MRSWAIIVAAGSGNRFGGLKQFESLGTKRVVDWAIETACSACDGVVVVVPDGQIAQPGEVTGGATRSQSVRNGLAVVPDDVDVILVHDGARPFASATIFADVIAAVRGGADGAVPGVPVTDTIKQVTAEGVVVTTPDRSRLVAVQTPQAFSAAVLRRAYAGGREGTDDAAVVEAVGAHVVVVSGEPENRKITLPDDLSWARDRIGH